jgi:predicted nucleic acid-binding protein
LPETALLDANVLHPMVLCDLLIRLAQRGLYRALWSREILEEVVTSIAKRRPDLEIERLRRRTLAMETALEDATVEGYDGLIEAFAELGSDAHVLAAAVMGHADVIVTSNVRDFPERVVERYRIAVQSPDDFLIHLWWLDPATVVDVLREQAAGTAKPALTGADILARLRILTPGFVELVSRSPEYQTGPESGD